MGSEIDAPVERHHPSWRGAGGPFLNALASRPNRSGSGTGHDGRVMSFHLAETPTLEAVATEDEELLAQDLKVRVEEGVQQAESQPEVAEAADAEQHARSRLDRLRAAERALS